MKGGSARPLKRFGCDWNQGSGYCEMQNPDSASLHQGYDEPYLVNF